MTGAGAAPAPAAGGPLFAEVALDVAGPGAPRPAGVPGATFHYSVPPSLAPEIAVGQLVWVPFGQQSLQGLVTALAPQAPVDRTRDVAAIVEPTAWLSPADIQLARWMSRHYRAPLFECLRPFLPPGAPGRVLTVYRRTGQAVMAEALKPELLAVLGLFSGQHELTAAQVARRAGRGSLRLLPDLVAAGLVTAIRRPAPPTLARRRVNVARRVDLTVPEGAERLDQCLARTPEARPTAEAALDYLAAAGDSAPVVDVTAASGATRSLLGRLVRAGLVVVGREAVWRDPLAARSWPPAPAPVLSADQGAAWRQLAGWLDETPRPGRARVALIHGVTGSGKTELYLRAIEHVLARGQQAIVLVPEIALTPQAVARFAARLGPGVGLLHSALRHGERLDTWRRARTGELQVIIGSRSATFAPLPRLGLVVIDEEHAESYKQDVTPRYHARAVAVRRAALTGSAVILGSATPAVETWHAAASGRFRRLDLPRRVAPPAAPGQPPTWVPLPPVRVVDMRSELRAGHTGIFSRLLLDGLATTLAAGEQAILFLNRRGSNTFVLCRDCGHVRTCPRCELPLTFHGADQDLVCHHCHHREPPPAMCPHCAGPHIRYFGAGTQRVESTVQNLFPSARVLRWDADTTRQRGAHEALLERFASGEADVLVGTQMVSKGLDLPNVTLVGVVLADTALSLPDFRAAERTFQMLTQVAGRAGRAGRPGRVVFQTYRPDTAAIQAAAKHDAARFYGQELAFRAAHRYPPFARLARLEHWAASDRAAQKACDGLARQLRANIDRLGLAETDLIGPAPAFFHHLRGQVRWQLVLRGPTRRGAGGYRAGCRAGGWTWIRGRCCRGAAALDLALSGGPAQTARHRPTACA